MKCIYCNTANSRDAKYCESCGKVLLKLDLKHTVLCIYLLLLFGLFIYVPFKGYNYLITENKIRKLPLKPKYSFFLVQPKTIKTDSSYIIKIYSEVDKDIIMLEVAALSSICGFIYLVLKKVY